MRIVLIFDLLIFFIGLRRRRRGRCRGQRSGLGERLQGRFVGRQRRGRLRRRGGGVFKFYLVNFFLFTVETPLLLKTFVCDAEKN